MSASLVVLALLSVAGQTTASAQFALPSRLTVEGSGIDRYVGTDPVGDVRDLGLRYYVDLPDRTRVLALEYLNADNRVPDDVGLELTEEQLDLGVYAPLLPVAVKLAGTVSRYAIGGDYWALGLYPSHATMHVKIATSFERDADRTVHLDGIVRLSPDPSWTSLIGVSDERSESHAGSSVERRYGIALERWFPGPRFLLAGGSVVNDEAAPTWMFGVARCASLDDPGVNPAVLVTARKKEESQYLLGIATLWGRALSQDASIGILESVVHGSYNRSRVVRNRDFGTVGVGSGYDAVDFGNVTATVTRIEIEAGGGAELRESEYALYGRLRQAFGAFHSPYVGVAYQTSSDLLFDPQTHGLDDPEQDWKTLTFGWKFNLLGTPDPERRERSGFLRVQTDFRFDRSFDGATVSATIWS